MTKRIIHPDAPLLHPDHRRPRTRREFLAQGLTLGTGTVLAGNLLTMFPSSVQAALSQDLQAQLASTNCNANSGSGSAMVPFLCFDLAGGANIAGSNVLVGHEGGQLDPLSAQGYSRLGLPGTMLPTSSTENFVDTSLGVAFHSRSALLRGIKLTCSVAAMAGVNGCVIPARSENDTGNNPHNPMYGIYRAGARGELINLVGSEASDSGGNSMAPSMLIDVSARPTQVTRPADVTGLVGSSGDIPPILSQGETVAAMESIARISNVGIDGAAGYYPSNAANNNFDAAAYTKLRETAKCEIVKSADSTDKFGATSPDPTKDPAIVGNNSSVGPIFTDGVASSGEFLKTASIMKLVLGAAGTGHYAAAGTISMGGYDYHTGDRASGEMRDERAGKCIGACIEYAHRMQTKLMLYVFSDGSVSSNGGIDDTVGGGGKNNWDSDNQATGAALILVYQPGARPTVKKQQLGWMRTDGSVEIAGTPGANSVTQLVDMVVLNYLALHNLPDLGTRLTEALGGRSAGSILGGSANWDKYTVLTPLA